MWTRASTPPDPRLLFVVQAAQFFFRSQLKERMEKTCPKQRKEPLTDAEHVRNAVARFDQVIDVSEADRALAFANIEKAADYYDVNLAETSWHDLGIHPQKNRREAAAKGTVTREGGVRS
jgi:hypothetical protein